MVCRRKPSNASIHTGVIQQFWPRAKAHQHLGLLVPYEKRDVVGRRSRSQWLANLSVDLRFDRLATAEEEVPRARPTLRYVILTTADQAS
jgi:hypothetical protein